MEAESEIAYSEERCAAFSATERFINGTRIRSANVIAAKEPKSVEVGERRCLLLAQICELLPGELLQCHRVRGMMP